MQQKKTWELEKLIGVNCKGDENDTILKIKEMEERDCKVISSMEATKSS